MSALRAVEAAPERPWAIYARLSKAQDGSLEKCEWQVKLCRDYATARSIPVAEALVFTDDSLSAWKRRVRRPGWEQMMTLAEGSEIGGILVWKVDRFTRQPKDGEALIDLDTVGLDGPGSGRFDFSTAMGRQQFRWACLQAVSESDNTSERCKAALRRKMEEGKPMGAGRIYGFEIGGQIQRPYEAAVIREVAKRMLAGETAQGVSRDLNRRGLSTARGKPWRSTVLTQMMIRPRNAGHVEHRGEIVGPIRDPRTGEVAEPILDPATYEDLLALVKSRRRGTPVSGRYLLTGIMRCGRCGQPMMGKIVRRGTGPVETRTPTRMYICAKDSTHDGCARSIKAEETEQLVANYMNALLADPRKFAKIRRDEAALDDERARLLSKVEDAEEMLAQLETKWAMEEITQRAYDRAKPVLDRKLASARSALADVARPSSRSSVTLAQAAKWENMNDDERRALILGAHVSITIEGPGGRGPRFMPERVVISRGDA
jgi:DNA invertase Pin-like site-specific DNA recombinase